jgi:hypothetical protein
MTTPPHFGGFVAGQSTERRCQALLSHGAAHLFSATWTHVATSLIHVLWSWIAEMMVPPWWILFDDQFSSLRLCGWTKHRKAQPCSSHSRSSSFIFRHMDSRFNVFDPRFVELDCGDDGALLVDHLQRSVQIFEFSLLDKAPKGSAKLFSATAQLIFILEWRLTLQCL